MTGKFEVTNKRDQIIGRGGFVKLKCGQTISTWEARDLFKAHPDIDQLSVMTEIHGLDVCVAFFHKEDLTKE